MWHGCNQKSKFLISVGGCWGQSIILFWKLVVWTKISMSQNFRTTFKQILACIFLSIRPKSLVTLFYEIVPCTTSSLPVLIACRCEQYWKFQQSYLCLKLNKFFIGSKNHFNSVTNAIEKWLMFLKGTFSVRSELPDRMRRVLFELIECTFAISHHRFHQCNNPTNLLPDRKFPN